jgi:hypothetical protein
MDAALHVSACGGGRQSAVMDAAVHDAHADVGLRGESGLQQPEAA